MSEELPELPDIEVELPKLPPKGYGNDGYSALQMQEYAVQYAYIFARQAVLAERERCAMVCDRADKSTHPADLADMIRKGMKGE